MADQAEQPKLNVERSEDFVDLYANHVQFEATLWDLKLLLGQTDLARNAVVQHTSLALPWPQAKIAAYLMVINVLIQQTRTGVINIPKEILPLRPATDDPGLDDQGRQLMKYLAWVHDQFFGPNPYVPPEVLADAPPQDKPAAP